MKYLQIERGHTPLKYKKNRKMKIAIIVLALGLAIILKLIHFD